MAQMSSVSVAPDKFLLMGVPNEMAMLGYEECQRVVDKLKEYNINNVWLVGPKFAKTRTDFRKLATIDEVKTEISRQQPQGHYILIKGSNEIKLFELPKIL